MHTILRVTQEIYDDFQCAQVSLYEGKISFLRKVENLLMNFNFILLNVQNYIAFIV